MKRLILVSAFAFALAGCSHIDTGQTDYRIADAPGPVTQRDMSALEGNRCTETLSKSCDPLLPSRVLRRYMPDPAKGWDAFKNSQIYSIEIEQGLIGSNILEGRVLGHQFGKTAEIAVLANVFEFATDASDAAKNRFLEAGEFEGKADDPSDVELKLIYFGDDIQRHQAMNFSNIPLRARSAYGGGSVGIQLVIMEVDAQSGPVSSLLKTLAKFGQQAIPAPGEAKDLLFDLGESLLAGSKDDKLLEYRFVLSAATEDARAVQATFAPGRYVIRRSQIRTTDMGWNELRLDHNTGRLFRAPPDRGSAPPGGGGAPGIGKAGSFEEVRDDLYLVLNIRRYPDGTKPEFYAQKDWSEFRAALQSAADARAASLDAVTADVVGLLEKQRSTNLFDDLKLRWAVARNRLELYSSRFAKDLPGIDVTQCNVTNAELQRRLDMADREASDAIRAFRADYQQAIGLKRIDKAGKPVGDEFAIADRQKLVSTVATYFMPWTPTGTDPAGFADAAKFEATYIDAGAAGDLTAVALSAAGSGKGPWTCEGLLMK